MPHNRLRLVSSVLLLASAAAAQLRAFGADCAGHLTRPPGLETNAPLVAGSTSALRIDAVAGNAPYLLLLGMSNTRWSGVTLPFDTTTLGFPGCFLNVSYDKVFGLRSDTSGRTVLPVRTAGLPVGLRLFAQVAVPAATAARLAASRGFELTLVRSEKPFNVIAIPDTQYYVTNASWSTIYAAQTQWIATNRVSTNSVFVTHVGDVVENGGTGTNQNKVEWDRADAAMKTLDGNPTTNPNGLVPYATAIGAHDYDRTNAKGPATRYLTYFGASRFGKRAWFGGAHAGGLSSYQVFTANSRKYLHLALEWRADDSTLSWARRILTANPEIPTLVTTHEHLRPGTPPTLNDLGSTPNSGGDNGARDLRHKLVEPFPQVFLVISGHLPDGGYRISRTILDRPLLEVMFDYQFDPNGGNGWMNRLEFRPDRGEIESVCFSPTYKPGTTPGIDRRATKNNNFKVPYRTHNHRRFLQTTRTIHLTGDHDHGPGLYRGALDTFVSKATPTRAFGTSVDVVAETPTGSGSRQALLKFGDLFGTGAIQVPPGKRIVRATLTLTTEGSGAKSTTVSSLYRLLVPFVEGSTWSSLGNGIQVGTEAVATPVVSNRGQVSTEGTRGLDVTQSLRAWQAGAKNHGWVIVNAGSDAWSFRSHEWGTAAERPMLTVVYER